MPDKTPPETLCRLSRITVPYYARLPVGLLPGNDKHTASVLWKRARQLLPSSYWSTPASFFQIVPYEHTSLP